MTDQERGGCPAPLDLQGVTVYLVGGRKPSLRMQTSRLLQLEISGRRKCFTYAELLCAIWIIFVIFVLCSIQVGGGGGVGVRAPQTKAMSNAKQIGLACKQYAIDHDGHYPSFAIINGTTSKTLISDYSNTAFDRLLPTYLTTIQIFYESKSAWTPVQMKDPSSAVMTAGTSLPAGSNEWAYVTGLDNTSDPRLPLIASGFADLKSHAYTTTETARGGVWKGRTAIVVFCDGSAKVIKCNPSTYVVPGSPNGADLFDTGGQPGWLNSPEVGRQNVLNPQ